MEELMQPIRVKSRIFLCLAVNVTKKGIMSINTKSMKSSCPVDSPELKQYIEDKYGLTKSSFKMELPFTNPGYFPETALIYTFVKFVSEKKDSLVTLIPFMVPTYHKNVRLGNKVNWPWDVAEVNIGTWTIDKSDIVCKHLSHIDMEFVKGMAAEVVRKYRERNNIPIPPVEPEKEEPVINQLFHAM